MHFLVQFRFSFIILSHFDFPFGFLPHHNAVIVENIENNLCCEAQQTLPPAAT